MSALIDTPLSCPHRAQGKPTSCMPRLPAGQLRHLWQAAWAREAELDQRERQLVHDAQQVAQRSAALEIGRARLQQLYGLSNAPPDRGAEVAPDSAVQELADGGVQSTEDAVLQGVEAKPLPDRAEMRRRHAVLCDYVKGRNWGLNEEMRLMRQFVVDVDHPVRAAYPWLFDYEWVIVLAHTQGHTTGHWGRGDLVFTDGQANFLVVEAKYLQSTSGKTSKVARTAKRKQVREQVVANVEAFQRQWSGWASVRGLAMTNENYSELRVDA
ncbi:hypothetical protein WJX72_002246 [[Myrmecia] bisecta]|uniref:NERD domain-containing protein n=1 Tax=[Myrmecia] bisecta TaxID=41462 RepID=A0AAW1Q6V4_9CHLO